MEVPPMKTRAIVLIVCLALAAALILPATSLAQSNQTIKKPPVDSANVPPNRGLALLKPDLTIHKIWFAKFVENADITPPVPITGDLKVGVKVLMICDLANDGLGDSKGLWLLGFYIDNVMMWNNTWSDLAKGDPKRGVGPYTPTVVGNHAYRCVLDVDNKIAESNENNNQKEILFKVVK
jgi:hypothetical protein